jgi:hypothetical protein
VRGDVVHLDDDLESPGLTPVDFGRDAAVNVVTVVVLAYPDSRCGLIMSCITYLGVSILALSVLANWVGL